MLLAASAGYARADFNSTSVGTAGSEFLNLDVGPRGIAMGGAYSAVTDDSNSMYWNPAGLTRVPRASLSAMHNEYLAGIRLQYISYAQRINDLSVLGGAVRYMDAGGIDNTDVNGNVLGQFHPRNYVFEFGWGQNIIDLTDSERDISLGATARYFRSDLVAHANGFAGDLGVQARYTEAYRPFTLSFVGQNMGRGQKFDQTRDNLPFRLRLGAAINWTPNLILSIEGICPISDTPFGAIGTEYAVGTVSTAKIFLRAGYNTLNSFNGVDGFTGASFGTGIKLSEFAFDYAFVPFGQLGNAHRFAVSWNLPAKSSRRFRER
jgi:hypothetical protein